VRGAENAGLELNGPMRRGGKCMTAIKQTKNAVVENVGMTKCKH